jgi:predicted ATPase
MLVEFRFENHRSIQDEQALSLEAANIGAPDDPTPRAVAGHGEPLLPAVALYGANASGKSNVLAALAFVRDAVLDSHRFWEPDGGVPRDPFAWGASKSAPSTFTTTFLVAGCRYEYGFVADGTRFLEEWLWAYPVGRKQVWFERDGDSFHTGDHLRGVTKAMEQMTRPNALFLSTAAQLRQEQLLPVFSWFRSIAMMSFRRSGRTSNRGQGKGLVPWLGSQLAQREASKPDLTSSPSANRLASLRQLLREADLGIVDVKLEESLVGEDESSPRRRVLFQHRTSAAEGAWLPLEEESHGTQTLALAAPSIIDALVDGTLVVIDELESRLHPLLAMKVVRLFNDPVTNPHGAQLVFTTHDTNLLGNVPGDAVLRRDQVWFTEKDETGSTRLYPLTDYKPRKAENLERGYLQGRYGGIPFLGEFLTETSERADVEA